MGGEVCFAIRRSNREERVWLQWTNIMPRTFAELDFIHENWRSAFFKELWGRTNPRGKWPKARLVKKITPSEYGVVLVDFVNKRLLSRQGYCSPGQFSANMYGGWETDLLMRLESEKRLLFSKGYPNIEKKEIGSMGSFRKRPLSYYMKRHHAAVQSMQEVRAPYHQVYYSMAPFIIDHDSSREAANCWFDVERFLRDNGWKTPQWRHH